MTRKPLVLWDLDIGLDRNNYSVSALTFVKLYRDVAKSANRVFILCLTRRRLISMRIMQMFDHVFIHERGTLQCLENALGEITEALHFSAWRYSGIINRTRLLILWANHIRLRGQ